MKARQARTRRRLLASTITFMKTSRYGREHFAIPHLTLTVPRAEITRASRANLEKLTHRLMMKLRNRYLGFAAIGILDIGTPDDKQGKSYDSNLHMHLVLSRFVPAHVVLSYWRKITGIPKAYAKVKSSGFYKAIDYFSMRSAGILGHKAEGFRHISKVLTIRAYYNTLYRARILHYYLPKGVTKEILELDGMKFLKGVDGHPLYYCSILTPKLNAFMHALYAWLLRKPGRCPACEGKLKLVAVEQIAEPPPNRIFMDACPALSSSAYPARLLRAYRTGNGELAGYEFDDSGTRLVLNAAEVAA